VGSLNVAPGVGKIHHLQMGLSIREGKESNRQKKLDLWRGVKVVITKRELGKNHHRRDMRQPPRSSVMIELKS